jgi:Flp pilus assembly protein TadG
MQSDLIMKKWTQGAISRIGRFARDIKGVAAIEFAFVVPILLVSYLGVVEVGRGINANKKVGRVAAMVGDLIAQDEGTLDRDEIDDIIRVGSLIREPFTNTDLKVTVTALQVSSGATPQAQVVWSRKLENGGFSRPLIPGAIQSLPSALLIPGSFLIRVKSEMRYQPAVVWVLSSQGGVIDMGETYYNRPRVTPVINCTDC